MRLVVLIVFAACSKPAERERCERGIRKVLELTVLAGAKQMDADERAAIDQVERQSVNVCIDEGLSTEQLECLLAMKSLEDFQAVTTCPAIKAKHPSWLLAGPPPT